MSSSNSITRLSLSGLFFKICLMGANLLILSNNCLSKFNSSIFICSPDFNLSIVEINICLFIDPVRENIFKCKNLGINYVELHTGKYANLKNNNQLDELKLIKNCAELCNEFKINCHAGHGLNFENVSKIAEISYIRELNIGHSLISYSIFNGLENSIIKMINLLKNIREI